MGDFLLDDAGDGCLGFFCGEGFFDGMEKQQGVFLKLDGIVDDFQGAFCLGGKLDGSIGIVEDAAVNDGLQVRSNQFPVLG